MNVLTARRNVPRAALALLLVPLGAYFLIQHAFPRLEMTEAAYTGVCGDREDG